jgi:hypothetical protein
MPKDFVFVDLSPVKSEDEQNSDSSSTPSSPTFSENSDAESFVTNNSSISDISFDSIMADDSFNESFDFGFDLLDEKLLEPFQFQNQAPAQQTQNFVNTTPTQNTAPQFETPVTQLPEVKRSKSVDSIKKKPLQFKSYSPKSKKVKKPVLKHRHTISEPVAKPDLDYFMSLNNQIQVDLKRDQEELSNLSSISDDEFLQQPLNNDFNGDIDQFLLQKQDEFDLSAFVSF